MAKALGTEPEVPHCEFARLPGEIAAQHFSRFYAAEAFRKQFFHSHAAQSVRGGGRHTAPSQIIDRTLYRALDSLRAAADAERKDPSPRDQVELRRTFRTT